MKSDYQWDKTLKIDTCGRIDGHADEYHYPYEPTPYCVLEYLVESDYISKDSVVVDYGCGKGRVPFFLNHKVGCHTIGVEYNKKLYEKAEVNRTTYKGKNGVEFYCENAEEFRIINADVFYFFNPFSVEILRNVIGRIRESYYETPRVMRLFFYYPNDEYISYLMSNYELSFVDDIDCQDLFLGTNNRERILIFEMG